MKAPTNVLIELRAWDLSNGEVGQLADMLHNNKQIQSIIVQRLYFLHGEGVDRIGEALHTNTVLEELLIMDTTMEDQEMEALVGALIPDVVLVFIPLDSVDQQFKGRKEWSNWPLFYNPTPPYSI